MKQYSGPMHFLRACALSIIDNSPADTSHLNSLDLWIETWLWLFRNPLARLVGMTERTLAECQTLGTLSAHMARVRLQSELIGLPETDSLHTIMHDVTPIREIYMGEDFDPDEFVALLRLVILTFRIPPKETQ